MTGRAADAYEDSLKPNAESICMAGGVVVLTNIRFRIANSAGEACDSARKRE